MDSKREFTEFMIESGALLFGDFTLKSGRKSPYFINTGEYKSGEHYVQLGGFYSDLIKKSGRKDFTVLYGPAYKGIPLAVAAASELFCMGINMNVSFNRKERKDHGEKAKSSLIMGYVPQDGDRIAIIEDVTTAGTSVRETLDLLDELNIKAKIVALYISVDRMEKGTGDLSAVEQIKREYGIEVYSIITVADIIEYLENPENPEIPEVKKHAANMREYLSRYGAAPVL